MCCINPKIIINPSYINSTHVYSCLVGFSRDNYTCLNKSLFDYKYFHPNSQKVSIDTIGQYMAVDPFTGDSINVYLSVPCGKCEGCSLSKQSNLKYRMILEQYGRKTPMFFVTLTYDNDHLPSDGVNVDDCQKFFKRFRERLAARFNYTDNFRYILFSEYGKLHSRPHYHFILFGFDLYRIFHSLVSFDKFLHSVWQNGYVYTMQCNPGAFSYVSKYVLKKKNVPPHCKPNFVLGSRRNGGVGCSGLMHPDVLDQLVNSPDGSVELQIYGKTFKFVVPKQVYSYLFKDNVQSLRRKYLRTVRSCFYFASELHYIYSHFDDKRFFNDSAELQQFLGKDGIILANPNSIVEIAPYCPEYSFYRIQIPSHTVLFDNYDYIKDNFLKCYHKLKEFNTDDYCLYLQNSELLRSFVAEIVLRLPRVADFESQIPRIKSDYIRATLDLCRDLQ